MNGFVNIRFDDISGKSGFIYPWESSCKDYLPKFREAISSRNEHDDGESVNVALFSEDDIPIETNEAVDKEMAAHEGGMPVFKYEVIGTNREMLATHKCVCPGCVLFNKDFTPVNGRIELIGSKIYLKMKCEKHIEMSTLLYSSFEFYSKCNRIVTIRTRSGSTASSDSSGSSDGSSVMTLEDMRSSIDLTQYSLYGRFIVEIRAMRNGQLISRAQIDTMLQKLKALRERKEINEVIVKIDCGLSGDIRGLNEMISYLRGQCGYFIIVNATVERLRALGELPESLSCFGQKKRVAPCLKYYLQKGKEMECVKALRECVSFAQQRKVEMACEIGVEAPYPNLEFVLEIIRRASATIRYCVLFHERSPRRVVQSYFEALKAASGTPECHEYSFNTSKLFELVEDASGSQITEKDFFPMSIGTSLEPILHHLNIGKFFIQGDMKSAYVTCLLMSKSLKSVPVTRLIDMELLWSRLSKAFTGSSRIKKYDLYSANKLRKIVEKCKYSFVDSSLINPMKIYNVQLIIVREKRDIFALDESFWGDYREI